MSISANSTPDEGDSYLLNRLITDLVGTLDACNTVADYATDATFDCLGSVYPLIGTKAGTNELIGTTVSIGGGYLLAAKHSLIGYLSPFLSYGEKTFPGLGVLYDEVDSINNSERLDLQLVDDDISNGADIALLRVKHIEDCRKLKSARFPEFESKSISSGLLSLVNNFGVGALFIGFGAMRKTGLPQKLQKNDIATFICNRDLTAQTISQIFNLKNDQWISDETENQAADEQIQLLLTMGSSQRYPYSNDSGGGLFVFYEGKVYLVGLHFKAVRVGGKRTLTYPLFVNLLSVGSLISKVIKKDRISFLGNGKD